MDCSEYMRKRGWTDKDIDKLAEPYEKGEYELSSGVVYQGSHLDAVEKGQPEDELKHFPHQSPVVAVVRH